LTAGTAQANPPATAPYFQLVMTVAAQHSG